jgi:hypothetical protein
MKIQFEPRPVVIGVVTVISVVAILGLAQTPTPTCTPKNSTEELQFHLVLRCVQKKDFPKLVTTIANVPCEHKYIQIDDGNFDGGLPVSGKEACSHTNSNVTQRVAFVNKTDLDTFIKDAGL